MGTATPAPVVTRSTELAVANINSILPKPKEPNYDSEVLDPLHKAQALEAVQAAAATQQAAAQARARAAAAVRAAAQATANVAVNNSQCYAWMQQAGITDIPDAYKIIQMESGCNPNAVNRYSGACGIGQELPCGKWAGAWNDPVANMEAMQLYVTVRYGSWQNALAYHYEHDSY